MSIIDYTKNLTMFDNYELKVIEMIIDELKLKQDEDCKFLNEISLKDVEFYWYTDSDKNVLGGFHLFSFNVIYMNRVVVNSNEEFYYANKAQQIIQAFPVIIHELCHYWQFKKNPLLFIFLQLPIIREFTIQKQAYRISEYLYDINLFNNMSFKQVAQMKKKYNFSKLEFDKKQLQFLKS